ncbi:hypothetical protein [Solwaraspora sp. WMMA2101]|uniref:hypothetical protein n=1 Tax=Solwaraspora sp. WMMA2101 TaxID=3404124 RepID=UPI003B93AB8C
MVRIPSLTRRTEPTASAETAPPPGGTTRTAPHNSPADPPTGDRTPPKATAPPQTTTPPKAATRTDTAGRDDTVRRSDTAVTDPATRPTAPGPRPEPPTREETTGRPTPPPAPAGPRPRASMLATLSLITGLVGALFVLSGPLAPYGIAIGVVALALGLGGISATARRHIAGRTEALMGIVLALGAMLVGSLALTGSLTWLTTETDMAQQVRQWLDSQFAGIF